MKLISRVYVARSSLAGAGWGVFVIHTVGIGAVLEQCVAFPFNNKDEPLADHQLAWDDHRDAMASGCANIYNHSDNPNVFFKLDLKEN